MLTKRPLGTLTHGAAAGSCDPKIVWIMWETPRIILRSFEIVCGFVRAFEASTGAQAARPANTLSW